MLLLLLGIVVLHVAALVLLFVSTIVSVSILKLHLLIKINRDYISLSLFVCLSI